MYEITFEQRKNKFLRFILVSISHEFIYHFINIHENHFCYILISQLFNLLIFINNNLLID